MFLMYPKTISAAAAAALFSLVAIDGATAEGGCGPGFHRNEFGRRRPNGPVVVAPGAPIVGAGCAGRSCPGSDRLRRRLPLASALPSLRRSVKGQRTKSRFTQTRSTAFRRGSFFDFRISIPTFFFPLRQVSNAQQVHSVRRYVAELIGADRTANAQSGG
jgi:hypothetical protein